MSMLTRVLAVVTLLVLGVHRADAQSGSGSSDAPAPRTPRSVSFKWPTAVVIVVGDTAEGVTLMLIPPVAIREREKIDTHFEIAFRPDSLRAWMGDAQFIVDAEKPAADADFRKYASPILHGLDGQIVFVGQDPAPPAKLPRYYVYAASAGNQDAVRFYADKESVVRLLAALDSVAERSRWTGTIRSAFLRLGVGAASAGDHGVGVVKQPKLRGPKGAMSGPAEVYAQWVVTAVGTVDTATIEILFSDHPELTRHARAAILEAGFEPAVRDGQPVAQLVRQRFTFMSRTTFR